jgi:hypothetical protein
MRERTVVLMDAYGWTFWQVVSQPAWALQELERMRMIREQLRDK